MEGNYSAHYFVNDIPAGIGMLRLYKGVVTGSDAGYDWKGTYSIEGSKLKGTLTATPVSKAVNIFGTTESIQLVAEGTIEEGTIMLLVHNENNESQQFKAIMKPIDV